MEPGSSVRYQRLKQVDEEEEVDGSSGTQQPKEEPEEEDDEKVTIYLYSPSAKFSISRQKKETCFRITAALVLLTVALCFGFYELMYGSLQPSNDENCLHHKDNENMLDNALKEVFEGKDMNCIYDDHHHEDEGEEVENHHSRDDGKIPKHDHEHGVYHHFTVVTDSAVCSEVGKNILVSGGNVIDAGIAATLCIGVVHPHAAGIGAVFSALFHNGTSGTTEVLNAIPSKSSSSKYGVPMSLQALRLMYQLHGSLEWSTLFSSTVQLAREGFTVDHILARALQENEMVIKNSRLCDLFCNKNRTLRGEGSTVTNEKLADLLQNVSTMMDEKAITTTLTQLLVQDFPASEQQPFAESMTHCDVKLSDPLKVEFDNFILYGASSPAVGSISAEIIEKLDSQNLTLWSISDDQSTADTYSHFLDASRQIYSSSLDEAKGMIFTETSMVTLQPTAVSESSLKLNMAPSGSPIVIADSKGNILMLSSSLNSTFGSKLFSPSTGIILNDFTKGTDSNILYWASPLVLNIKEKDDFIGVVARGGSSVPFGVAQSIINKVYFGKSLKESVTGPFFHLKIGEDGAIHTYVSGLSNSPDIFTKLLNLEPELKALSDDSDQNLTIILVESRNGHVSSSGNPDSHTYSDGY